MADVKNLIITGKVGCGKTTLIKEATLPWREKVAGFYTEEIREGSERSGFRLKTFCPALPSDKPARHLAATEGVLAAKGLKSRAKLNKYGVDLNVLEKIGVTALEKGLADGGKLIVIDEIGSMEILSPAFRAVLAKCLQSARPVLATIRFNSQPFTDEIKKMAETRLALLTRENYPQMKEDVRRWMEEKISQEEPRAQ